MALTPGALGLVLLLVAVATSTAAAARLPDLERHRAADAAPWFCHGLDCPSYTVVKQISNDVEVRQYDAGAWVSTNVTDSSYDSAVSKGFMALFAYISGANDGRHKVAMTCPVRVLVTPGDGPFCEDHYTISFFVPFAYQDAPPQPLSADLFVERSDEATYFVLSYPGRTNEQLMLDRANTLVELLDRLGLAGAYDSSTFYTAGYDSPFRLFNRHNEIWLPARME